MKSHVCLSLIALVAADYIEHAGYAVMVGNGGDAIDSKYAAPTGLTEQSCKGRCDADATCSCVSFRPSDGKCWKHANCAPSQFGADSNFSSFVKAGASGYTRYDSKNCLTGHGGTEIDSDATAPAGQSVASCEGRCDADKACGCVTFRPADGKCWKRGACAPLQFEHNPRYDTYVKDIAPSPTPTPSPPPSPSPSVAVSVTTLHWNPHRPCGTENPSCISTARQRLAQMAFEVGASIVGAVELKDANSSLPGWQSSGMQCDNSAVMVAPGWAVRKSGGFCMNGDSVKGFAVALVAPPQGIQGCPQLCIMMGHVPHGDGVGITGHSEIASVCGSVADSCMIAMGDWNADDIGSRWASLIGGSAGLVDPHEKTCCNCDPGLRFADDHTATNIAGAVSAGHKVFDLQLTSFGDFCEHKPTSVQLRLPGASPSASSNPSDYIYA